MSTFKTVTIGQHSFVQPIVLAPMEDITDQAFRRVCKRFGVDWTYIEFVSSEALLKQIPADVQKLKVNEEDRPIGIQLYGKSVAAMVAAAQMAEKAKPDFLDLNFGCSSRRIVGGGAGAELLRQPELMAEITRAVVNSVNVPVTVKTRLGWDEYSLNIVEVSRMLEDCGIQALTIHGRTRVQKFKGKASWSLIAQARQAVSIPVIGNGDIATPQDVKQVLADTQCHGVMIGRAAIGNPWIFQRARHYLNTDELLPEPSLEERIETLLMHLSLSILYKGCRRGILEMGKHNKVYLSGLPDLRQKLAELSGLRSYSEIRTRLYQWLHSDNDSLQTSAAVPEQGNPSFICLAYTVNGLTLDFPLLQTQPP